MKESRISLENSNSGDGLLKKYSVDEELKGLEARRRVVSVSQNDFVSCFHALKDQIRELEQIITASRRNGGMKSGNRGESNAVKEERPFTTSDIDRNDSSKFKRVDKSDLVEEELRRLKDSLGMK